MIENSKLEKYIVKSKNKFEDLLGALIEIPTVSMNPANKADILAGAQLAASYLADIGARVEILETKGNPIVLGYLHIDSKAPTVTLYHHLDVQPASPSKWHHHPFQFTIKNKELYLGRGATDDKGPAITALMAAKFVAEENIPINIKFIWEMEEEIGSPNFEYAIKTKKENLTTDSILVSDTIWISRQKPAIPYGLRGLMTAILTLTTGERDAHSGLTGGAARNPIGELCQIIDHCYDPKTGRVKIEGFYDKVMSPSIEELKEYENSEFNIDHFKKDHGLLSLRTEDTLQLIKAIWCEPTFEVHGITGGYLDEGIKTIVPHFAQAKMSTRLVPNQNPMEIFQLIKEFVKKENPDVEMRLEATLTPYLGEFDGPYAQAARQAMIQGFGVNPVFIREGGSIGPVVTMQKIWSVPVVLLGLSLPEHGYHAPNEYYDWGQAAGGIKTLVHYFDLLSQMKQ